MELLQLKYFYKIACSDTLTQAARELHVSQPSLSSMLRKIESEMGGKLFDKNGRILQLNQRGKILLRHTEEILNSLNLLEEEVQMLNQKKKSCLTIQLHAASHLILPIIKGFQEKHPDIQINIIQNQKAETTAGKEPDLIITADWRKPARGILLFKEDLLLAVPKEHRLANWNQAGVEELENEGFILLSHGKLLRDIIDYYCKKMHFSPKVVLESDDLGMVKELIQSGFGISIIPSISWCNVPGEMVQTLRISTCPCYRYVFMIKNECGCSNDVAQLFGEEIKAAMRDFKM